MKIGVIDVGGGLRGIYGVGVFDYCMDHGIHFDLGIGISAGSANLASYAANQKGRNYQFYTEYAFRKQYMSLNNFITKKTYVDMDYVYGKLSNHDGEYPLDYETLKNNPMEFYVVATNALNGQAKFFAKEDIQFDQYDIFKASSSIPVVCPPYEIKGNKYYDGALGDPVPIKKAFSLGCDLVVLILTKPVDVPRKDTKDCFIASFIRKKNPIIAQKLCQRANLYNSEVALAKEYMKQGKVMILSPDDTCGVDTLKKNKKSLIQLYEKGYNDAQKINEFLHM